jgi:lipopolysaccharide transport system ATP-binding protein
MSNTVIKVENLSKSYMVGHNNAQSEEYTALRDVIARDVKNFARKTRDMFSGKAIIQGDVVEEFWALKDVSFEIKQGDRVGIIGRNGAGKSTLLKILSRITEPTQGRISINGRVASLLEVGTGFHSELTGRENIFLNGAILGMSRKEIQRKFDEIVDFAEVELFLDTPVKRYSSGMYVRLAFAVAAHLEPEILIVDEVLAVGDAQFQRKCLGKMDEVANEGRTVLFVSHNMPMVSNLCKTGLVLDAGKLVFSGDISDAVIRYYQPANHKNDSPSKLFSSEAAELVHCELIGADGSNLITVLDEIIIRMVYRLRRNVVGMCVPNFHFFTADGTYAFVTTAEGVDEKPSGCYYADCRVPKNLLNEGTYFVGVALTTYPGNGTYHVEFFDRNAMTFNVIDPMNKTSRPYDYVGPMPGILRPRLDWTLGDYTL